MTRRILPAAALLLVTQPLLAGPLLDYIRKYDLNDYAFGVAVSSQDNPYAGSGSDSFAYPFLTSFRDSTLTDDWLLIRDGDIGLRWISDDSHWEAGFAGRIQTLGLGDSDAEELEGIVDREWALEVGPIAGWRGWPVHVNVKTFFELSDRHEGTISELALSWPIEFSRGYFVPIVELIHRDSDYVDYYFGVAPASATPVRPAYDGESATNFAARARWGWAINEKWLLSGSVGYEWFDSSIKDSPIVDSDGIWNARIGLAYNANVFRPRAYDNSAPETPRWEFRIGAFQDNITTKVARDTTENVPGFERDIEDLLGAADEETVPQLEASVRIGDYHRLELGYLELRRDSSITLEEDLSFGDRVFPAGTRLDTDVDVGVVRALYSYSLIRDAQKEVGVMAGLHVADFKVNLDSTETGQTERSEGDTPLPVIGAHASVFVGERTKVSAKVEVFRTDFDRFSGNLIYADINAQYRLTRAMSVGLGYNYYRMRLSSDRSEVNGYLKVRHQGPTAFVTIGF